MITTRNFLYLSLFVALATASTADLAFGKVVVCNNEFRARLGSNVDAFAQFGLELTAGHQDAGPTKGGIATILTIDSTSAPTKPVREQLPDEVKAISVPVGMSPGTSSLSQVTGSGVGGAIARCDLASLSEDNLSMTLPAESRLIRPSEPKNRWFRPPRNWH